MYIFHDSPPLNILQPSVQIIFWRDISIVIQSYVNIFYKAEQNPLITTAISFCQYDTEHICYLAILFIQFKLNNTYNKHILTTLIFLFF